MRLVKIDGSAKNTHAYVPRPRADYLECRAYKELDQLLYRVLQLNEILHHNCACGSEKDCTCASDKALDLKRQIWRAQKKLDRLYRKIGRGRPVGRR